MRTKLETPKKASWKQWIQSTKMDLDWPLLLYNLCSGSLWKCLALISRKKPHRRSEVSHCRLIWSALESSDPAASNVRSNVEIWPNATSLVRGFWNVKVDHKLSLKSAKKLTKKHFILSTRLFQTSWDQFQKVKRRRLTHRWMRQDQNFPAQVELMLHDKPVSLWHFTLENETKCSNFEQK